MGKSHAGGSPVRVTNPLSSQHSVLRQSLLGSLLDVVSSNLRHGRPAAAIFEVGKGYGTGDTPDSPTREWWRLGLALTGPAEPVAWNRPERPYDLDDGKGLVELLCHRLGLPAPAYEPLTDDPNFHGGRSVRVTAGEGVSGRLGELHPRTAVALDLRVERLVLAELAVAGLAAGRLTDARGKTAARADLRTRPSVQGAVNDFDFSAPVADPTLTLIEAVLVLVGTICTLAYFHFGARVKNEQAPSRPLFVETLAQVGQLFLAVTLGSLFAGVFSAAITALIERLHFLGTFFGFG